MEISACSSIAAASSKHATEKEAIFKLFRGAKRQQLAGKHLPQWGAAGPAMLKCFCMHSLIRIRHFISVAAWLISAIIHFLCGSQLQVLKCVSISIRCLLLFDINTCFWLSLEMFYFGFNAGSSQELQKDTQLFIFQARKDEEVEVGGLFLGRLWPPKNFKRTYSLAGALLGVRGYFQVLWQKVWGLFPGGESPQCPREARWGGGRHGAPHYLAGCRVLAPRHSIQLFLFTCVFPPGIASHISAFPNTKVSGSLPRDLLTWGARLPHHHHHPPPPSASIPHFGHIHHTTETPLGHHRGLEVHDLQYH